MIGVTKRDRIQNTVVRERTNVTESIIEEIRRKDCGLDTYPERRLTDYHQPESFIAMLLENAAKEDKQSSGWKTPRMILNYGIYNNLKMP